MSLSRAAEKEAAIMSSSWFTAATILLEKWPIFLFTCHVLGSRRRTPSSALAQSKVPSFKNLASALSGFDFWVEPLQFMAGVVDFELPIDATLLGVGFLGPDRNFRL